MKLLLILSIYFASNLLAVELQIKSNAFSADEKKGISVFEGNVKIVKAKDELNASKVTVYTNKENEPTKFVSEGKSSFKIFTENGSQYTGKAQKVVYLPKQKEYQFFTDVHLIQVGEKKEIIGEQVVLKTIEGKAYAKSSKSEPVIMIFNIQEKKENK